MRLSMAVSLCALMVSGVEARAEKYVLVGSWASGDVRRYREDGTLVDTFIQRGSGGLGFPDGLAYGPDDNLYVADGSSKNVLRYNGTTGAFMDVFVSTGLARAGYTQFGPDGNLYVCSGSDNTVQRFDGRTGAYIDTFASAPEVRSPAGLAWKDGTMYVSGFGNNTVGRFDAVTGEFEGLLPGTFNRPLYVRVGTNGDLYISNYGTGRLLEITPPSGPTVGQIMGGGLSGPVGQAVLSDGTLLVTSWNNGRILRYNEMTGEFLNVFASGYPQANDILLTPDIVPSPGGWGAITVGVLMTGLRRRR